MSALGRRGRGGRDCTAFLASEVLDRTWALSKVSRNDMTRDACLLLAVSSFAALHCENGDAGDPTPGTGGVTSAGGAFGSGGPPAGGGMPATGGSSAITGGATNGGSTGGVPSVGGAGGNAGAPPDASAGAGGKLDETLPARTLAETDLYSDAAQTRLSPGVTPYEVRSELWADGASKKRYLSLPEGKTIDTSNPDGWVFPVGTKVWKEFTRDGVRVETRLIEKFGPGQDGWKYVAFAWNSAQTEAVATPLGAAGALGTAHDIPSQSNCFACHMGSPDFVLGVSAFGLRYEGPGLTLSSLAASGRLTKPIARADVTLVGDAKAIAALDVLNANCGHCHRPGTFAHEKANLELYLKVGVVAVGSTPTQATAVNVPVGQIFENVPYRIRPGQPAASAVYTRMTSRKDTVAMPNIATKTVDTVGSGIVADWIAGLQP